MTRVLSGRNVALFDQIFRMLEMVNSNLIFTVVKLIVSLAVLGFGYRIAREYFSRVGGRLGLEEHTLNILQLVTNLVAFWLGTIIVIQVLGLPTDWFVGASALAGTAIGFGSSQTIGNFVAGLYILVSRPFTVHDFVKIGDVEGQVEEITINYTMVYTRTRNLVKIPNRQVLNSRILHCTKGDVIDHSFTINFDHSLTNERVIKEVIEPAIKEFYGKHREQIRELPKYYLTASDRGGKTFTIRLFFRKGDARSLYNLQPILLQIILDLYYVERDKKTI